MARNDDLRIEVSQLLKDADPPAAVDVSVMGWEQREDGEEAGLHEVAGEQDAFGGQEDHLITAGVRRSVAAKLHQPAAEIDVRPTVVDDLWLDELDALQFPRPLAEEAAEHLEVAPRLVAELLVLR